MNTTHTVRFELPPSRALRFLVGLAVLYAVFVCRERIFDVVFSFMSTSSAGDSLGSVTGVVLPLLIEFVMGVGYIAILVGSFGWNAFLDVASGIVSMIKAWRARSSAVQEATTAATEAAEIQAGATAGAVAGASAIASAAQSPPLPVGSFPALVQNTLRDHRDLLDQQRAKMSELAQAVSQLAEQVGKLQPKTQSRTARKAANNA